MFQISESTNVVHFNVEGAKKTDVKVVGTFEEPWFCGRDVCEILEYKDIKQALQKHVQHKSKKSLKELSEELCVVSTHHFILGSGNLSTEYHDGKTFYINVKGLAALLQRSKLIEYGIVTSKRSSNVKDRLDVLELVENIDYSLQYGSGKAHAE